MENWLFYIGIPLILGIWAQARVTGAFRRYSQVRASSGLTGAEAAREIMDAAQIRDVDIVQINGVLGDHYDPTQEAPLPLDRDLQQPLHRRRRHRRA